VTDAPQPTPMNPAGVQKAEITDARGRKIVIRKLNALDRLNLFEVLGAELSGNAIYVGYSLSAASVVSIDGQPMGLPARISDIKIAVKLLDDDGLEAVSRGYQEHFSKGETGDLDAIKN